VSEETRKRVLAIAEELGYTPNHLAKSLRTGKTKTIGIVVSDISNPFFGTVIRGIGDVLRREGYHILLCDSNEDPHLEEETFMVLLKRRVDGMIVTTTDENNLLRILPSFQKVDIPCVLLARYARGSPISYVAVDDVFGSFTATEYLIQKGHKRILYLAGPPHLTVSQERLNGYVEALKKHGIEEDGSLIRFTKAKMEDGYEVVKSVLSQELHFTAIGTFNDYLAFGAMRALQERGLRIPDDIAVVGYDDVEFSAVSWVPLTTVRIPRYELGIEAARLLLSHIKGETTRVEEILLKPELVIRGSA
jgi:LacI family transcriptional regulator